MTEVHYIARSFSLGPNPAIASDPAKEPDATLALPAQATTRQRISTRQIARLKPCTG